MKDAHPPAVGGGVSQSVAVRQLGESASPRAKRFDPPPCGVSAARRRARVGRACQRVRVRAPSAAARRGGGGRRGRRRWRRRAVARRRRRLRALRNRMPAQPQLRAELRLDVRARRLPRHAAASERLRFVCRSSTDGFRLSQSSLSRSHSHSLPSFRGVCARGGFALFPGDPECARGAVTTPGRSCSS